MHAFFISTVLAFTGSYAAKLLADASLDHRVAVLGEFAGLQYSRNPGIAFGVRLPAGWQEVFIVCALLFVCWLAWTSARTLVSKIGYGLIVGGALANVIDRVRDGFVTDFFQVGTFPIFNVADSCITIGVAFLLAESFALRRRTTV